MFEAMNLTVNNTEYRLEIKTDRNLLSVLRSEIGLTGAKEGCDDSECGACMVLLDGKPVNSCSILAVQAVGRIISTVEGLGQPDKLNIIQKEFIKAGAVQCGFCTPGMIVSSFALLMENPRPSGYEVRVALSGNLCRCTGYQNIVEAVLRAAELWEPAGN
jgi:carbon-monoxide dehydrogenase small subunit